MTAAIIMLAVVIVMAVGPSREQLAKELADRNDRCGHVEQEQICLRQRAHAGSHQYERINRVIPIGDTDEQGNGNQEQEADEQDRGGTEDRQHPGTTAG